MLGKRVLLLLPCLPLAGVLAAQTPQTVYQQAAADIQRGDPNQAIVRLAPILEAQPADLRALTLAGMALSAQGKPNEAGQRFRQALNVDPGFAPALRGLALNEMAAGKPKSAEPYFEALLQRAPADPVAHLGLGEIRCADRRYSECLQHFEHSNGGYLLDARTVLKFADAAIQLQQPAKAEAGLVQMPEAATPEQHLQAGLMLARIDRYKAAIRQFELAGKGPDAYLANYNLALAMLKAGDYQAAIQTSARLIAAGSATAELYNVQAQAYEKTRHTKEAFEALRTATQIDPGDETNYLDLIGLCLEHKNLDVALDIVNVANRRIPRSDRLQLQTGIVRAMRAEYDEAKQAFAAAAELAPDKALPQVALGLVLLQMDQVDEATKVLRRGSPSPQDQYLLDWFLAEALSRTSTEGADESEAIAALRRSIARRPDISQTHALLGKLLVRRGELDEAVEQLERALQMDRENMTATYQLAVAYRKKGNAARANELFAKVSKAKSDERGALTKKGLELMTEGRK